MTQVWAMLRLVRSGAIPLNRDLTGRFLPVVLGVMVLLACLMLVGASVLASGLEDWRGGLEGHATVQVLPKSGRDVPALAERQAAVMTILEASDLVLRASVVPDEVMGDLLEPWLGVPDGRDVSSVDFANSLPIPVLVDVTLKDGVRGADLADLRTALGGVRGVVFDDHGGWLRDVRSLASMVVSVAYVLVVLIVGAAVLVVVLLVRAGMTMHRDVVELLHLVGATDQLIAWQFQRYMVVVSLRGAVLGGLGAAVMLSVLDRVAGQAGLTMFAGMGPVENLFVLLLIPFAFVVLSAATSGMIARKLLVDMP